MFLRILFFVVFFCLSWTTTIESRVINVTTIATPPFFTGTVDQPEGFIVDLLNDLKDKINAANQSESENITSYQYSLEASGKYGEINDDLGPDRGRWLGLIGAVVDNRTDMAVAPLIVTPHRANVVHFTRAFMSFGYVPLVKTPPLGESAPFNDREEAQRKMEAGNLTVGFIGDGRVDEYASRHKSSFARFLSAEARKVRDRAAGIVRVREEPNYAYYDESVVLFSTVMNQPCDVQIDWDGMIGEGFYAFALPKTDEGRQLAEKFDRAIMEADHDGTLAILFERWWIENATCPILKHCSC